MATIGPAASVADPYSQLGLAPGASAAEVKRAYRRLAMDIHPDHAGSASLQTFLAIKAAYEWIVAHSSFAEPGDRRRGSVPRSTTTATVRGAAPRAAEAATEPGLRSSWPGGRWYWEGLLARASRRARTESR
jgi:curved DNA-binding protein CbpA